MTDSSHLIERISKWTIDEDKVESSDLSWREMYEKQRKFPALVLALVSLGMYWMYYIGEWSWLGAAAGLVLVVYSFGPALGSYYYMQEVKA